MTKSTEMRSVTGPDEPGRGYRINRKPVLIAVLAALVAVATALSLFFAFSGSSSASSASGHLQGDGYTVTRTYDHSQIVRAMGAGSTPTIVEAGWLDSAAYGHRGRQQRVRGQAHAAGPAGIHQPGHPAADYRQRGGG